VIARLALASLLSLSGCGYTDVHEVVLRQPQPRRTRQVEIYFANQTVPRPFYEIALLQAVGHGTDADAEDVGEALSQRAASLGCDAIVRTRIDQGYSIANAVGVCVRWAGRVKVVSQEGAARRGIAPAAPAPAHVASQPPPAQAAESGGAAAASRPTPIPPVAQPEPAQPDPSGPTPIPPAPSADPDAGPPPDEGTSL